MIVDRCRERFGVIYVVRTSFGDVSPTIWVARLHISRATAHKIANTHGLHEDEVRWAVQCVSGLRFVWDDDPVRGRRALVEVKIRGTVVLLVLYPRRDPLGDSWDLGSAYPLAR